MESLDYAVAFSAGLRDYRSHSDHVGQHARMAKGAERSVIQSFNLTILVVALVAHLIGGFVTKELLIAAAVALPVAALGTWLGVRAYGRISDRQFTNVILFVLGVSGVMLIWTNVV